MDLVATLHVAREKQQATKKSSEVRNQRLSNAVGLLFNATGVPLALAGMTFVLKLLKWGIKSGFNAITSHSNNRFDSNNWLVQSSSDSTVASKQISTFNMIGQLFRVVFYNIPILGLGIQAVFRGGEFDSFYFPKSNLDTKYRK